MRQKQYQAFTAVLGACFMLSCNFKSQHADLVVHNGIIQTMDAENSVAEALAIRNGRIIAVGAEREILNRYSASEITDARGGVIVPGLLE